MIEIPESVRFVRLGQGGRWVQRSHELQQLHAGWADCERAALLANDPDCLQKTGRFKGKSLRQDSELQHLLDRPSRHVWITTYNGHLWWTLVDDGIHFTKGGETKEQGNFYLTCQKPWSNVSLKGTLLELEALPGPVGVVAGFRATCCVPKHERAILRAIRGEKPPEVQRFIEARSRLIDVTTDLVKNLHWRDFEALVDLVFARGGYVRVSRRGGTMESVDLELNHPESGEMIAVQIKAAFDSEQVREYLSKQLSRARRPDKLFFVTLADAEPIAEHVVGWNCKRVAELVVDRGLATWVASRVG